GVDANEKYDTIFWAMPFGFLDPGAEITLEEMQVFDPGYRAIRKFFKTAPSYLKRSGRLLIGFSAALGHQNLLNEFAAQGNITLKKIAEVKLTETQELKFELLEGKINY